MIKHVVLVQEPRKKGVYVSCRDVTDCLTVIDTESRTTPVGTRITMLLDSGSSVMEPLSAWRVEKRGHVTRYRINGSEVEIVEGDVLRLKLQRLPVYESVHTSAGRETSQVVTVRKITPDGRLIVRLKGKKPGYNVASISVDRVEMNGTGPAGTRPFRYLILDIEHVSRGVTENVEKRGQITRYRINAVATDEHMLASSKRGDVVKIGRTKWIIFRPYGSFTALAYKHPSSHRKGYEITAHAPGSYLYEVWETGGSGQRLKDRPEVVGQAEIVGNEIEALS